MRFFIISNDGFIENIIEAEPEYAIEGVTLVPVGDLSGGPGWLWNNGDPIDPEAVQLPHTITTLDIERERNRRLALGFDYDFEDERGVHRIATTPADMVGWNDVTTLANALKGLGDTTTTIQILTETGLVEINCLEWFQICIAAAEFRQPIWQSSFILSATDPIPEDFTDDTYWS